MDKQKDTSTKKDQLDSTNKELNPIDHNYSTNNEITSSNNKTNLSNNSTKDEGRPKKRLKNLKDSKSNDSSTIKSNNETTTTKKSTTQRKSEQNKQKDISSSQINQTTKDDIDKLNQDNDQNMNDQTNDNETTVTSTTSNKKSSKDNLKESTKDEQSTQNLPRVPPLRIVINSNLSSNKKDNDKSNSSTNLSNSSQSHTTTEKSFSIDNQTNNSTNLTITTNTSTNSTNLNNLDDIDNDETSNNYSKDLNNTSTTGRVTRSQRAAAQSTNNDDKDETNDQTNQTNKDTTSKDLRKRKKNLELGKNRFKANSSGNNTDNKTKNHLNHLNEDNDDNDSTSSSNSSVNNKELNQLVNNQLQCLEKKQFQMPSYNCYHLYLNIRRQVDHRRTQQIHIVQPKIPDNFNQFLFNTGSYLLDKEEGNKFQPNQLEKNKEFILSLNNDDNNEVPKNLIGTNMNSLFNEQELERRKLKLQHRIEKDKLRLSVEQEILRVYARAELTRANLNLPLLSACTVLKDEEIYNSIDEENDGSIDNNEIIFNYQPNQFANPSLNNNNTQVTTDQSNDNKTTQSIKSCYDSKLLNELLQDVYNKWLKIKHDILLRHKREAESLQAVQKLQWDWKSKDFYTSSTANNTDTKTNSTNINVDDCYVPLVKVEDDFDLPIDVN